MIQLGVALALVNKDKEVLMQLRDNLPSVIIPGKWCLPGGRVEKGESLTQALKREFMEEVGYELINPKLMTSYNLSANKKKIKVHFYYEIYDNIQKIMCLEGEKMEFKSLSEMSKLDIITKHDKIAKQAIELAFY